MRFKLFIIFTTLRAQLLLLNDPDSAHQTIIPYDHISHLRSGRAISRSGGQFHAHDLCIA